MSGSSPIANASQSEVPSSMNASELPAALPGPEETSANSVARDAGTPRVLLIAYHFPPCGFSSGMQRTLCFSRDLREHHWAPLVLTAHPRAYAATKTGQLRQVPDDVPVRAAFALDTKRHLGIGGRYLGWMALPDPWVSWLPGAIAAGIQMIRKYRPAVLWSTYPIATAHLIGLYLHRITGVPWVADFRDPMTEEDPQTGERFPEDKRLWRVRRWIEMQSIRHCTRAVFVTPGSLEIHRKRYPMFSDRMVVIGNGYDEENFSAAERSVTTPPSKSGRLLLLHSGVLYPGPDRDPTALFIALAALMKQGKISTDTLQVRLRATGYDDHYRQLILKFGLEHIVSLEPATPYQEALAEMLTADGLLVFQGRTSNPAVPAKLYEYLRARRPIFALVDSRGDTAGVLNRARTGIQVPLDDAESIQTGLVQFLAEVRQGTSSLPSEEAIEEHSRKFKAEQLARLLNEMAREQRAPGSPFVARG
jgi:glycosyltransferase involved in cell wall biosynthesis